MTTDPVLQSLTGSTRITPRGEKLRVGSADVLETPPLSAVLLSLRHPYS